MRRILQGLMVAILLTIVAGGVFATGSSEGTAGAMAETQLVRYVVPGNAPQDLDTGIGAVNEKLADDGAGIELEVIYISWDAWDQRTNIMLSTGEPFELFHVMENRLPTQTFAGRGALAPLDDLIDEYGPALQRQITDDQWEQMKLGGEIYSIPAYWRQTVWGSSVSGDIAYNKALFDRYGLPIPESPEELIEVGMELQDEIEADTGETWYVWDHERQQAPLYYLRSLDDYPFYVDPTEEIIFLDFDGQARAYYETEYFRQAAEWQRELYTSGLRHPDILSMPRDLMRQYIQNGQLLFGFGTGPGTADVQRIRQTTDPDFEWIPGYIFDPEKPYVQSLPVWNSNSVPATTDTPEAGVKFLNWLYSQEENHDLFVYGVEGVHYEPADGIFIDVKRTEAGLPLYNHADWQIALLDWRNFQVGTTEATLKLNLEEKDNVVNSPTVGFSFDKTPVSTEYANVLAEREASMYPIKWGVISYDEGFDEAIARMRAAGLNRIVEEFQRQFDEWKSAQ